MGTYIEIDGKLYVTKEDYLNTVKYYENSLSAERKGAKEEIKELEEENKKLKEENENLKAIIEHYKKFEEGKNKLEGMLGEITSIKDGPITYRKDSTGRWVPDGEPPIVLC